MVRLTAAFLGCASAGVGPVAVSGANSPVSKIVETVANLLQSMQEEADQDGANYKQQFQWCQTTFGAAKQGQEHYSAIDAELRSKLKVSQAQNRQLADEVAQLESEIGEAKQGVDQGASLRGAEHDDYVREQKESANMLQVLSRARDAIQSGAGTQVQRNCRLNCRLNRLNNTSAFLLIP